jgi:hypothetical protein
MRFINSKKQGDAGLGAAIAYYTSIGATVSIPLTDSQDYDLVVEVDGALRRVQVRTTTQSKYGAFVVGLRVLGGNQSWSGVVKTLVDTHVDDLFVLTADGTRYLMPVTSISSRNTLTLGSARLMYRLD